MRQAAGFPTLLQSFFTKRLIAQRRASPHTIACYRDTFRLLLRFAHSRTGKAASTITLEDLDATLIGAFLDDLETGRNNAVRSRNLRMTAIRSFFRYAAIEAPQQAALTQRVLAIPNKLQDRRLVGFLLRPEIDALIAAPNRKTWLGRRDHALLLTAVQTGLRLSEITALRQQDVVLGTGAHVRCQGKECHSYCISFRRRNETTIIHACRQACDLAFSLADVLLVVRTGIGLGPYTDARGACRVRPMSEPYPA
jgi:integrase/recombinase XerD